MAMTTTPELERECLDHLRSELKAFNKKNELLVRKLNDANSRIAYLELLLIEDHDYFKCKHCGDILPDNAIAHGFDDCCELCVDHEKLRD